MTHDPDGLVILPDAGQSIPNPIGGGMMVKVRDAQTAGAYSVHHNIIPAGSPGPRPHIHHRHEELFFVVDGELTVQFGDRQEAAPAGSFVVIPRGVAHRPSNRTEAPVTVLLVFSPAGMDRFFVEAAERRLPLQAVPDDPAIRSDLAEFTARYGYEFADGLE